MSSLVEIVEAIRDTLETAMAASSLDVQVDSFRNLNPSPPSIDIYPADPFHEGDGGFGSEETMAFTVRARIGTADVDAGQDFLLSLMDEQDALSVFTALTADQTLGGVVSSLMVDGPSGHQIYEDVAQMGAFLGVSWKVRIER